MNSPSVQTVKIQELKVTCPYCIVGYAIVHAEFKFGQTQIHGINDPRKCVTCKKYFKLKPRVQIEGVQL